MHISQKYEFSIFRIPIKNMRVQLFLTEFQSVQGVQVCTKFVQTYLYIFFRFLLLKTNSRPGYNDK